MGVTVHEQIPLSDHQDITSGGLRSGQAGSADTRPPHDLGDWEQVGVALARALLVCGNAYVRRNGGESGNG
jgi:hypothetical protein